MEPDGRFQEENEKPGNASQAPSTTPQEQAREAKATKVLNACRMKDVDLLRALATSEGGLVSDTVRRQACS